MYVLPTLFQKIDGPGPPLGNSLNGRIRNDHLTLGVEALCLHAESAEGGPGTVPAQVFTQQAFTALSCQPSGSITFTLESLPCVFTCQSLHCSSGGGQHPLSVTAGAGTQFCSLQQTVPLTAVGAKLGPRWWKCFLPWNLNAAERVRAATCSLCTSQISDNFPPSFLLPEEKCSRQHGGIGWMGVPWISQMEGTVKWLMKNTFRFFFLPSFLPLLCREGRVSSMVGSARQRHSDLCWRLYLLWSSQRGASGHEPPLPTSVLRAAAEQGRSQGLQEPCAALWNGARMGLVRALLRLCLGCTLGSQPLWGARGLTGCLVLSSVKWGDGMGKRPFSYLANLRFCVRARAWCVPGGQIVSWRGHKIFEGQTKKPARVPWFCCLREIWFGCALLKPAFGDSCHVRMGHK